MAKNFGQKGEGCSVIEDDKLRNQCEEMFKGKHSWRGYQDTDFKALFNACKDDAENTSEKLECGVTVRRGFQGVEDGRFDSMLEEAHRFFFPLDKDEVEDFVEKHPILVKRIEDWGVVQEAATVSHNYPEAAKKAQKEWESSTK